MSRKNILCRLSQEVRYDLVKTPAPGFSQPSCTVAIEAPWIQPLCSSHFGLNTPCLNFPVWCACGCILACMEIDFFDVSHATAPRQLAREIPLTRPDKSLKRCLCVRFWVMPFHATHHGSQDASLLWHKKGKSIRGALSARRCSVLVCCVALRR